MDNKRNHKDGKKKQKFPVDENAPDVFEMFLPSLWLLRLSGAWLPGDLKEAPSIRESLRGGPRAILYFLFSVIVFLSVLVLAFRFIPYALKQTGGELYMVVVIFICCLCPIWMYVVVPRIRTFLVIFVQSLNAYFLRYGQPPNLKYLIRVEKRSVLFSAIFILVFQIVQFFFCFEISPSFHWITTPVSRGAAWYIQVPWKAYLAATIFSIYYCNGTTAYILRLVSIILRLELVKFNQTVKRTLAPFLVDDDTCDARISSKGVQDKGSGCVRQVNVVPYLEDDGCEDGSDTNRKGKEKREITVDELDSLRCRFERLVGLLEKGNSVVKFQLLQMYWISIPYLCLIIKGLVEVREDRDYIIYLSLLFVCGCWGVIQFSIEAVRINLEAHASCEYLLKASVKDLSEKAIQIINLFMNRLNGPPIGFRICGLITIDVPFLVTLVGTFIGYIFVVLQFSTPSCGPAMSNAEIYSTVTPLNGTLVFG